MTLQYADRHRPGAGRNGELAGQGGEIRSTCPQRCFDRLIGGHDDAHIVAEGLQDFGQRAGYVGQSARFGKGRDFGADEKDS